MAAYAASGIADSDSMTTGLQAFKLGIAGFIIPFLFIYYPGLLIIDTSFAETIYALVIGLSSVLLIAASFEGWAWIPLHRPLRVIMFLLGIITLLPNASADIIGLSGTVLVVLLIIHKQKTIEQKPKPHDR
jgi:TRAP-type uncharacterized transport system fused permease subunit